MSKIKQSFLQLWVACALGMGCGGAKQAEVDPSFSSVKAFNSLTACTTTNFSRFTRGVDCGGTRMLFISREPEPGALMSALGASFAAYGVPAEPRTLRVNNRDLAALSYTMGVPEKPAVSVLVTALPLVGSSESVEAHCYVYGAYVDPKRCASLLDDFIEQGLQRGEWPKVLSSNESHDPIMFDVVGRGVRLPSSCDELAPFDVQCKEGHVRLLMAEDPSLLPRMLATDLKASADPALAREWTTPCTVEGVATTCTIRRYRLAFNDELHVYRATTTARGQSIMVSCETRRSVAQRLPGGVCSQFFWFEEGALEEPPLPEEPQQ